NGAGKTTTMHMLLGLTTPTSGRVCVLDIDINGKKRAEALQRVNFSSSYVSLPYSLTVVENLTVFSRLYRIKNRKEKIAELMDIFGLNGIRNEPTRRLSSGQITRVSLAKSLLNDPEVLFLDEPTASLDPDMADRTRTLLRKIGKERGMSMLYTSHNMAEMEEICDRIIFLNHGKIIAEGRSEDVVRSLGGTSLEDAFLKVARRERGENVGG
ncbi:MAG: ABC transporter ATP-binding protein, partial [Deltaproteobacteria bacterium]|nr:ABC transporter ATP-binding protein [Deltaproteobacteria bacterium]